MTMGGSSAAPLYLPNVIAAMVAAAGVIVGSIGPWATFMAFTRGATDGDGMFTLILGVVAVACLFALLNFVRLDSDKGWLSALAVVPSVAGVLAAIIAVIDMFQIRSMETELFGRTLAPEIGWGLWLLLISSVLLAVTATIVATQLPKLQSR